MIPGSLPAVLSQSPNDSVLDLILYAGPVAKVVLGFLCLLSVVSWAVILFKYRSFRSGKKQSGKFHEVFWSLKKLDQIGEASRDLPGSHLARIFDAGYAELQKMTGDGAGSRPGREKALEIIERALLHARLREAEKQESFLTYLATTGNAAPFIGLFGTVWGIMDSFRSIGMTGSANLAVVAPGISEALITTAAGLFAAIPAVMAYNYFINRARAIGVEMDAFSAELLNVMDTHFL